MATIASFSLNEFLFARNSRFPAYRAKIYTRTLSRERVPVYKLSDNNRIVGKTRHGELTIDQLGEMQPGMARLMDELWKRFWYMYYAAKGGNWKLAAHNLSQARSLFKTCATVRPKYAEDIEMYSKLYLEPLAQAISAKKWAEFEIAFQKSVEGSDVYHDKTGHDYIRFVLPSKPPEHLDLRPPEELRKASQIRP